MTDQKRITIGRSMAAVGVVSTLVGWTWLLGAGAGRLLFDEWLLFNGVLAIGVGLIAWIVLPSQPRNGAIWPSAIVALTAGLFVLMMAWVVSDGH